MNKSEILSFIQAASAPVTNREIARAFRLKGSAPRIELKKYLKQLEQEGAISKNAGGGWSLPEGLPAVATIEVTEISIDGDVFAIPTPWNKERQGPPPRIEIKPDNKGHPALTQGDRALARLERLPDYSYAAFIIRKVDTPRDRMIGVVKIAKHGAVLESANKKERDDFEITDLKGAKDGDLAVAEIQSSRTFRDKKVRIVEVIGRRGDPKAISLISLYEAGINPKFPDAVIKETQGMSVPSPDNREDLRNIPLVTIDGIDAKDFDDAVFAEKTEEGFHLIVAIADVAYYVRPETQLDKEAYRRGNSTYFPDRVVPMLPEVLSNDLCSLRPNEPRACLAAHMWIDKEGKLIRHKFVRGLMKSAARLTYEQVQHVYDQNNSLSPIYGGEGKGEGDAASMNVPLSLDPSPPLRRGEGNLWEKIIQPLYETFRVLDDARRKRGALDLDLPERKVILDDKGNMRGVTKRLRLDSHKLIEEFMVLANVAAAQALEFRKAPCAYRIHDSPSPDKLDSARDFIESFGLSLPKGQVIKPSLLNQVLLQAAKLPYSSLISMVILRTQSQAHYSPDNIGHFGLALQRYAHFTSPIRRYSDLIVHRSLIAAYQLGPGGIDQGEVARLQEICENISATERTSMEAERGAVDRFTAAYLSQSIGAEFSGAITGVTRFGLFVVLEETGADGLVPIRSLPTDFYIHDERAHALVGRRTGRVFRMGAPVTVRLMEADGLTGSTLLNLVGHEHGADIPGMELKKGHRAFDRGGPRKGGKDRKHSKKYQKRRR